MLSRLPPAGNPVIWKLSDGIGPYINELFSPLMCALYGSGTSSLAAAICASCSLKEVSNPEVILPAYTCPNIISAVIYAGATPVLVDFDPLCSWISLGEIKTRINDKTVAIIAVSLFGIPERFIELKKIADEYNILLIEDCAQYFPESEDRRSIIGDMRIYSFGRGKPVSILAGGMIVYSNELVSNKLPVPNSHFSERSVVARNTFAIKVWMYNTLLKPHYYWLPDMMPFLKLGETRYEMLNNIASFPVDIQKLLPANIEKYWDRPQNAQALIHEMLLTINSNDCLNLPGISPDTKIMKLVRYPVLASTKSRRDHLYDRLTKEGLGVSKMYKKPLIYIDGIKEIMGGVGHYPNAEQFADRLFTLPVHDGVTEAHVDKIGRILATL